MLSQLFSSAADHDRLLLPSGEARRRAPVMANPLNDDEPLLRTTLLPGLFRVLLRNLGRGFGDVGLFEVGRVFLAHPGGPRRLPSCAPTAVPPCRRWPSWKPRCPTSRGTLRPC